MTNLKRQIDIKLKWYDKKLIEELEKSKEQVWIAGGAILSIIKGEQINDLDVYVSPETDVEKIKNIIKDSKYKEVCKTENAITYRKGKRCVQLITCFKLNEGKDVDKYFDFSVCSNAYSLKDHDLYVCDINGIASNYSYILGIKHPLPTLHRLKKYRDKGYRFPSHAELYCATTYVESYKGMTFETERQFYQQFKKDMETIDLLMADYGNQMWEIWGMITKHISITNNTHMSESEFMSMVELEQSDDYDGLTIADLCVGDIIWKGDSIVTVITSEIRSNNSHIKVSKIDGNKYDYEQVDDEDLRI